MSPTDARAGGRTLPTLNARAMSPTDAQGGGRTLPTPKYTVCAMTSAPNPASVQGDGDKDAVAMRRAADLAVAVRTHTTPNPWVGCVIATGDGRWYEGATRPPGGPHAEIVALTSAGAAARGATLYTTLEPCVHHGRTPPCTDAIVESGVARVVVGVIDPDREVSGRGVAELRSRGVQVDVGVNGDEVSALLAPYLKHRRTGRPWVVLKLAATLDGRIAAPDGNARWITGEVARADAHRLRAESDAVMVGAGTVRADDPELTVRLAGDAGRQPLRVVLGGCASDARVRPALELGGEPGHVLDVLGARGVLQVLVEGGARVAHAFHRAGLVDRYVLYLAPALFGGDDGVPLFRGDGAPTMASLWRGRIVSVRDVGGDLRIEIAADAGVGPSSEAA
jgi:diaminohydroxyphosphoribosylaminopyrimidine deaminase / 5-amino-6-(5-phosphoribosylamino)uracil reductase